MAKNDFQYGGWNSDENFEDTFIRFGATHERDRRTDRRSVPAIAALMHSIARQKSYHQPSQLSDVGEILHREAE